MTNKKNIIIVGGGYLGAMSALIFSKNMDLNITLVEKQNRLCGLYNTAVEINGRYFDYGSRAILETGVAELDDTLFSILPDHEYPKTTDNLREFSVQNGKYCNHSNCLDARTLAEDIFNAGKKEMLSISPEKVEGKEFDNLEEFSLATYGPIFTKHLIKPAIEKLTGVDAKQLDPVALTLHGLQRIIIADRDESKALKNKSDFNGNRIAFAKFDDNKSSMIKTYPLSKGLSDYGERIKEYLDSLKNVDLRLNDSITGLEVSGDNIIQSATLESGEKIAVDELLWTIPSIFFARMQNIEISGIKPPVFRNSVLCHYVIDGELKNDAYFVYNYDNDYSSYRSTFYDNFSNTPDDYKSITVEVFHDSLDPDLDGLRKKIFEELISSELISENSEIIDSQVHFHRGSWPNFACGFFESQADVNAIASGNIKNVHFAGKANGKHHSTALVHSVKEIYDDLIS